MPGRTCARRRSALKEADRPPPSSPPTPPMPRAPHTRTQSYHVYGHGLGLLPARRAPTTICPPLRDRPLSSSAGSPARRRRPTTPAAGPPMRTATATATKRCIAPRSSGGVPPTALTLTLTLSHRPGLRGWSGSARRSCEARPGPYRSAGCSQIRSHQRIAISAASGPSIDQTTRATPGRTAAPTLDRTRREPVPRRYGRRYHYRCSTSP